MLWICTGVCGCCVTRLGVSAVSCGALLDKLRMNAALARSTEAGLRGGLVLAGGLKLLLVAVLLQMRLLMDAWLKQPLAGSRHV